MLPEPGTVELLDRLGPERCESASPGEARDWCRRLAERSAENFSVLSGLVPEERRDDFGAVYAFCRWADDLGDEAGSTERATALLAWWREELDACYAGQPRHPVFVALRPTIERQQIPREPFADLIDAFGQDQRVNRYQTWEQLLDYCRRSADPVGRLVLMVLDEPRDPQHFGLSDKICTALQLTNHWQDIARDVLTRDRIYLPAELNPIVDFERRLRTSAAQGFACDREFLAEARAVVRECVNRTWPLFEEGAGLLEVVSPRTRPILWLFIAGGTTILQSVEAWNYETVLHRPKLSKARKLWLVARAWIGATVAGATAGKGKAA